MKILLVEDDPFLHRVMIKRFKGMKGVDTLSAFDGVEAFEKVKEERPDLILLDIILPKENGFTFLEKLRKNKESRGTNVIVITNLSGFQHRIQAKKLGVKAFFEKANIDIKSVLKEVEVYANT